MLMAITTEDRIFTAAFIRSEAHIAFTCFGFAQTLIPNQITFEDVLDRFLEAVLEVIGSQTKAVFKQITDADSKLVMVVAEQTVNDDFELVKDLLAFKLLLEQQSVWP